MNEAPVVEIHPLDFEEMLINRGHRDDVKRYPDNAQIFSVDGVIYHRTTMASRNHEEHFLY